MNYGVYKTVRNASWQCLIDYKIKELPINLKNIAQNANIKIINNSDVNILIPSESGAAILRNNKWYIIIDDENSIQRCRFTVAHELGHIFLGHSLYCKEDFTRMVNKERSLVESEADIFASRLLAPACVLWGLHIHSAEDIAKVCNLSITAAKIRAERLNLLYKQNKFFVSPLERMVFEQFKDFIEKY